MYFINATNRGGKAVLQPLSSQILKRTRTPIRTDWQVRIEGDIHQRYGLNVKFVVEDLKEGIGYYEAIGTIRVLVHTADAAEKATSEEFDAYHRYMQTIGLGKGPDATPPPVKPENENTLFSRLKRNKSYDMPTIANDGFWVKEYVWYHIIRNVNNGKSTMLLGQTGSGKTELLMMVFERLGLPLEIFDMSTMQDPIAGLLGVHRLKGDSRFEYARHVQAIKQRGGVLYDEISRGPSVASNILFPVLDRRRTLYVDVAGEDDERVVKVHKECVFAATANVGAQYTGTFTMDRALTRRFSMIEIDYPDVESEVKVYQKRTEIGEDEAKTVVSVLTKIRNAYNKMELSDTASLAEGLEACELVVDGMTPQKALEATLYPMFAGTTTEGERGMINKFIIGR